MNLSFSSIFSQMSKPQVLGSPPPPSVYSSEVDGLIVLKHFKQIWLRTVEELQVEIQSQMLPNSLGRQVSH